MMNTISPDQELEQLRAQLADAQTRCQHAIEEKDAALYEAQAVREMFKGAEPSGEAKSYLRIWSNCLGNMLYPKAHWIDALGMTTRRLNEDKARAEARVAELEKMLRERR